MRKTVEKRLIQTDQLQKSAVFRAPVRFFPALPFLHPDSFCQNIPDPEPRVRRCRIVLEYDAEHVLKILLSISGCVHIFPFQQIFPAVRL